MTEAMRPKFRRENPRRRRSDRWAELRTDDNVASSFLGFEFERGASAPAATVDRAGSPYYPPIQTGLEDHSLPAASDERLGPWTTRYVSVSQALWIPVSKKRMPMTAGSRRAQIEDIQSRIPPASKAA